MLPSDVWTSEVNVRTKVKITRKLGVTADRAWEAIQAIGRLDVWFPSISRCTVTGAGVGAERRLILDGGMGEMVDIVRSIDTEQRRLSYERVESPFPVSSYLGTVEVFRSFDGLGVVAWTVDFESEPDVADFVTDVLTGGIGYGVAGMDADLSD
jgi:hypothetical protein